MVYKNGYIITCDDMDSTAEAMIIENGRVEAVGTNNEIMEIADSKHTIYDLEGKTVIPGFIDSHVHMTQTGLNKLGVKLDTAKNIQDILLSIKRANDTRLFEELIFGIGYDDAKMTEKRPPTIDELDDVVSDKYVWLARIDCHSCTVNSKMFRYLDLPKGIIGIDTDTNGRPTGVLRAKANSIARKKVLELIDDKTREKALKIAAEEALRNGVTTLGALEGGPLFNDRDFEFAYKYKDQLPVDIELYYQTTDVDKVLEKGLTRMGGCIILDGSFGSRTAALMESYEDDPSTNGVLYYTQEEVDEIVLKAHKNNIQLAFHALGERSIEQILNAYEKALNLYPRKDHRHRIEHFELPTDEQIERAAKLGVVISLQPAFEHFWGGPDGMYAERLGVERAERTQPYRAVIEAGSLIIGGSDSDVTPISPIIGIHGAVNRSRDDVRIGVKDSLKMFTINGAKAVFKETEKGSIEKGKIADFVVLSENIYEVRPEEIKDIEVEKTIKNGKIAYSK